MLAGELAQSQGWRTRFLVADPSWIGPEAVGGFPVQCLDEHTALSLMKTLERIAPPRTPVFLHYVGYGYQKRGCPRWLMKGLEQWKFVSGDRQLIVMFHELFAFGPPWSSSFWLSPVQRRLTKEVATLADACVTNMSNYAERLGKWVSRHAGRIRVQPVFSTMGEPPISPLITDRKPWLVLFGGGAWLTEAMNRQTELLDRVCAALDCDHIIAVGARGKLSWSGRSTFEETGVLPAAEVSAILNQSRAGYLGYFSGYLGKSTIFGAYCAHGLLPVFPETNASEADGVRRGEHYLTVQDLLSGSSAEARQQVADQARAWYVPHNLSSTAAAVARILAA